MLCDILISRITVDDVKNNRVSEGSFFSRIVSKAKINTVEL